MKTILLRRKKLGKTSCDAIAQFSKHDIEVVRNDQGIPPADVVLRWGCSSKLSVATGTGASIPKVFNRVAGMHLVSNKKAFRHVLQQHGLCPKTWFNFKEYLDTPPDETVPISMKPVIVRPEFHSQGKKLWLISNMSELQELCLKMETPYYISEYIPKVAEYRVFVMSGRVICVAEKECEDKNAIAWNVAQGNSKFVNVKWGKWDLGVCIAALDAFKLSGLDWGGVDIMVDQKGEEYVLEINSAPSLTSPYRQQCFAKGIDWLLDGKEVSLPTVASSWKNFIHPAISGEAV